MSYLDKNGLTRFVTKLKTFLSDNFASKDDVPIFIDMTQSEYDALSDSEKNNGVYYNIILDEDN